MADGEPPLAMDPGALDGLWLGVASSWRRRQMPLRPKRDHSAILRRSAEVASVLAEVREQSVEHPLLLHLHAGRRGSTGRGRDPRPRRKGDPEWPAARAATSKGTPGPTAAEARPPGAAARALFRRSRYVRPSGRPRSPGRGPSQQDLERSAERRLSVGNLAKQLDQLGRAAAGPASSPSRPRSKVRESNATICALQEFLGPPAHQQPACGDGAREVAG